MSTEDQARDECTERRHSRPAVLSCLAGLFLGLATANAQNSLKDLGPGSAIGLNNSGQVLFKNSIYSNGTITALPAGFIAAAINASGVVVGQDAAAPGGGPRSGGLRGLRGSARK